METNVDCTDCPVRLTNPETLAPDAVAAFHQHQLGCLHYRQNLTAHGARFITRDAPLRVGDLTLDLVTRKVERAGKPIDLTLREFDLLSYLMRHTGRVCSRKEILENVWHCDPDTKTNSVTVHINRLRQAIDTGFEKKLIHTVPWKGYRLGTE